MGLSIFKEHPWLLRWGPFLALLALVWGVIVSASMASFPTRGQINEVAAFTLEDSTAGSLDQARKGARQTQLPSFFGEDFPRATRVIYEFEVPESHTQNDHRMSAVYVPWVAASAAVYVNDKLLHRDKRDPYLMNRSRYPLLVDIPSHQLSQQANLISIEVESAFAGEGRIESIYFGDRDQLESNADVLYFFKITLVRILSVLLVVLMLFAFLTHKYIQADALYPWFILMSGSWVCSNELYLVLNFPLAEIYKRALFTAATMSTIAVLPIFARSYMCLPVTCGEKFYRYFAAAEVIVCGGVYFFGAIWSMEIEAYIRVRALLSIAYAVIRYVKHLHSTQDSSLFSLWLVSVAASSLTLPLYSVLSFFLQSSFVPVNYFLTGAVHLVIVFASIYLQRVKSSFTSLAQLNVELDSKVKDATEEVRSHYAKLQQLREERLISKERERIMQDIHDGVAGHLVAALAIAKRTPEINQTIVDLMQESVTDLRLVIDSLVADEQNLNATLDAFHRRISPTIEQLGLELVWDVDQLPPKQFNSKQLLDLYRCLQEAIANIIKHADASIVRITSCVDDEVVEISIQDNGKGFSTLVSGRGLGSLESRMQSLGGKAEVSNHPDLGGVEVRLSFPFY